MSIKMLDYYKVSGTFDDLLNEDISFVKETEDFYFIGLKSQGNYDNTIYKVNKKTKEVSWMVFIDFLLEYGEKYSELNVEEFLKREKH